VIYNTRLVARDDAPTSYQRFADAKFKGRVGMARPAFGTTRGHMASLLSAWAGPFGAWLRSLTASGVRLLDGNAAVARAVGTGELHVGFADSDDVFAGQREGWPVGMAFIRCPDPAAKKVRATTRDGRSAQAAGTGTLLLPTPSAGFAARPTRSTRPDSSTSCSPRARSGPWPRANRGTCRWTRVSGKNSPPGSARGRHRADRLREGRGRDGGGGEDVRGDSRGVRQARRARCSDGIAPDQSVTGIAAAKLSAVLG